MAVEIPGYKIVRVLGKGGMATVYLAVQEIFEREVALKVMSPTLADDPQFGQRFVREARIVSQLSHPNIVTVYDVGVHNKLYYLSMAYVDGPDLKQAQPQLSLSQKFQVVRDLARALQFAGSKGCVHRDIKPENILLKRSDHQAILTDFGIARAAETDLCVTQTGTALGTPHYMSPEQAKGQVVDPRADLYSLGVVFYYLLIGRVPYHANSAVAIGVKHITDPIPQLPAPLGSLQPILDKLLAKLPEERYQSGAELLAQLDKVNLKRLEKRLRDSPLSKLPAADTHAPTEVHGAPVAAPRQSPPRPWWTKAPARWGGGLALAASVLYLQWPNSSEPEQKVDLDLLVSALHESPSTHAQGGDGLSVERAALAGGDAANTSASRGTEVYQELGRFDILGRLSQRVQDLGENLGKSSARLKREVDEQRSRLQEAPDDPKARAALQDLALIELLEAREKFNLGEFAAAQQQFARFQELFPDVTGDAQQSLQTRMAKVEQLQAYLEQAEQALADNRLVRPEGRNALHYYDRALAADEQLLVARLGRERVSDALAERAQSRFEAGQWEQAEADLRRALDIMPNNRFAQDLLDQLSRHSEQRQDVQSLLQRAKGHLAAGNLYSPEDSNAYFYFQRALALDSGNRDARAGLQEVHRALAARAQALVAQGDYDHARQSLHHANQARGSDGQLQLLSRSVEEAIETHRTANAPQIRQLSVDGSPLSRPASSQPHTVRAQRTLFGVFNFANFKEARTVLQAQLFEQEARTPLMDVPVILDDTQGQASFRLDRPQEGFPPGRYNLQLKLDGDVLSSVAFAIRAR